MKNLENPRQLFPLFISNKLAETKEFYLSAGFKIRIDMPEYLQVYYGEALDLCFMGPDGAGKGMDFPVFGGKGVLISIPTPNADKKALELKERRLPIVSEIEDKPWGWRSFHTVDPNGVILDFFHVYKELEAPKPDEQS